MTETLENELYIIDPIFFENAIACVEGRMNEMNTCMAFGCECGDGWFKPMKKLVEKIAVINELAKKYDVKFVADQVKEKWGYFTLYYSVVLGDQYNKANSDNVNILKSMIDDSIDKCVDDCSNVCEICGADGGYDNSNLITTDGWIKIICKKCDKNRVEESTIYFDKFNTDEFHNIPRITLFKGAYNFLNINHKYGFKYNDNYYSSIPLAYFCNIDSKNAEIYQIVDRLNDKSNAAGFVITEIAKRFGNLQDFTDKNYKLLKDITKSKFTSIGNEKLLNELLETKNKLLINMNRICDNLFGYCTCKKCKNVEHKNLFGKILMEIRNELK